MSLLYNLRPIGSPDGGYLRHAEYRDGAPGAQERIRVLHQLWEDLRRQGRELTFVEPTFRENPPRLVVYYETAEGAL